MSSQTQLLRTMPDVRDTTRRDPATPLVRTRAGFSMVEVIIAITILAVGVLGFAGTTAYIVRQVTLAGMLTERSTALQATIEQLQAMDFDSVSSGSDSVGVFYVEWTSATETSRSKLVTIVTIGPGLHTSAANPFPMLGPNVYDTFEYRVIN